MTTSLSTSTDVVYSIMNQPSAPLRNTDPQKAMSIGQDLQQSIQEVEAARSKGSTDTFRQTEYQINVLV